MFRMQKEKYYIDYRESAGVWVDKDVLVREDGFKLMRIGGAQGSDHFRYSDNGLSFEFHARRYAEDMRPTDTWVVNLGLALRILTERNSPISLELAREIAANIEEALRAWPPWPIEKDTPIKRVRFLMRDWRAWPPDMGTYYER
jgi:hypothetical protein